LAALPENTQGVKQGVCNYFASKRIQLNAPSLLQQRVIFRPQKSHIYLHLRERRSLMMISQKYLSLKGLPLTRHRF
jgi:hypothetical protein